MELLAPAGDFEKLKFAFLYGADAVYFGGQNYSLRANAKNFSLEEIKQATIYAHNLGKKVYVTVNIVFHDEDFKGLKKYLRYLATIKVDAVIVSDIAVIKMINENNLPLKIFLSTQVSVLNQKSALFWQKFGVKRIILAREASKKDIKSIKKIPGLEVETFVHGAMCTSFSGKCILSNYITNRDANRGGCAQICRWAFNVKNKPALNITAKDLNMVNHIADLIDLQVDSLKVEGRMRSIYYIATVILCYRRIIDKTLNHTLTKQEQLYYLNILNRCANRDSAPQFFTRLPKVSEQYFDNAIAASNQDFLGLVIKYDKKKQVAIIEQRNNFKIGDEVQFFHPEMETFNYKINTIYDKADNPIEIARHPQMIVKLPIKQPLKENTLMRIKIFDKNDFL